MGTPFSLPFTQWFFVFLFHTFLSFVLQPSDLQSTPLSHADEYLGKLATITLKREDAYENWPAVARLSASYGYVIP